MNKNIVLLVDDYVPDSTKVAAKMMHELAVELVRRGVKVTVITPSASINTGYQCEDIDGVEILRFRLGPIKNCGLIKRAINETLLPFKAILSTREFFIGRKIDFIISYSPSIFWGKFAKTLKKRFGCKIYLVLRDFFPQWVIDNGMIKPQSLAAKYFRYIERLNYDSADAIGIQSLANIVFFKQCFGENYHTRLLYNWASPSVDDYEISFREKLGITDKVVFFYGGNIGKAQDMANLVRLAEKMKSNPQAHFIFLGQGDEVDLVDELVSKNNISNVSLLPPVSQQEFKAILKEVDVGLFSLCRNHETHNFPGKILGYMVNQIPILGSVNEGNDLQFIIKQYEAGYVTVNGEDDLLFKNALSLLDDLELRRKLGANAQRLLHDKFTVSAAADEILSIL